MLLIGGKSVRMGCWPVGRMFCSIPPLECVLARWLLECFWMHCSRQHVKTVLQQTACKVQGHRKILYLSQPGASPKGGPVNFRSRKWLCLVSKTVSGEAWCLHFRILGNHFGTLGAHWVTLGAAGRACGVPGSDFERFWHPF